MIKLYARYVCLTAGLLFVQTSSLLPLGRHGIRPDLVLFVVLHAAVSVPAVQSACIVFIAAFFLEALSGAPTGFFIVTYLLVFTAVKTLCRVFNFNTLIELFGLLLVCLAAKHMFLCFFAHFVYEYHYDYMVQTVLRETFFTLILFPVVFPLVQKCIPPTPSPDGVGPHRKYHGTRV